MPFQFNSPPPFGPPPDAGMGAPTPPPPLPGPAGVNGIPGAMGTPPAAYPPMMPQSPADMKFLNETQQDGSVLLRLINADGTPGPVVKIVPPPVKKGKQ